MKNIKAVIFDFGGVILNIDFDRSAKAFAELGVHNFNEMYSQHNADHLFRHLEEGKISEKEFYDAFRRSIDVHLTDEQIRKAWNALLIDYRPTALETLKRIRPKYELYLLSNTNSIHLEGFTEIFKQQVKTGLLEDYFDKIYYSHLMGYRKPDKAAFEYVLKKHNLVAEQTLFVDDTIGNLAPAKELGMKTFYLEKGMGIEDVNWLIS